MVLQNPDRLPHPTAYEGSTRFLLHSCKIVVHNIIWQLVTGQYKNWLAQYLKKFRENAVEDIYFKNQTIKKPEHESRSLSSQKMGS